LERRDDRFPQDFASPEAMRRVSATLDALAMWGDTEGAPKAGRLTADLDPPGFDALAAVMGGRKLDSARVLSFRSRKTPEDTAAARARTREDARAAEKMLREATRHAAAAHAAMTKPMRARPRWKNRKRRSTHVTPRRERTLARRRAMPTMPRGLWPTPSDRWRRRRRPSSRNPAVAFTRASYRAAPVPRTSLLPALDGHARGDDADGAARRWPEQPHGMQVAARGHRCGELGNDHPAA
jgi:hypothetical protein